MRSALRRQPSSVDFGEYYRFDLEKPANGGVLETRAGLQLLECKIFGAKTLENLQPTPRKLRFLETLFGD